MTGLNVSITISFCIKCFQTIFANKRISFKLLYCFTWFRNFLFLFLMIWTIRTMQRTIMGTIRSFVSFEFCLARLSQNNTTTNILGNTWEIQLRQINISCSQLCHHQPDKDRPNRREQTAVSPSCELSRGKSQSTNKHKMLEKDICQELNKSRKSKARQATNMYIVA